MSWGIFTAVSAAVFLLLVVLLVILLVTNNRLKARCKVQATTLSTIYNSLPESVYWKDRDGLYTDCNHVFEKLVGLAGPDIIGKTPLDIFQNKTQARYFRDADQRVMDEMVPLKYEEWMILTDGTRKYIETSKVPLIQDGEAIGLLGMARDITDSKTLAEEAEEAHRRAILMLEEINATAAQLETVVSNYPGIIWRVDQEGTVTLFNGRFMGKIGFSPEFITGKKYFDSPKTPLHSEIVSYIQKTFNEGGQDWVTRSGDGVFHMRTTPITDSTGRVCEIVGSMDEITEIISLQEKLEGALEKANEASRAKSVFLAKMSHEIRTPMNAIIGMAELALREREMDSARKHISTIKHAGANLLAIINDILDFSKIESGKLEIIPDYYSFSSLVNDVISIIRMRAIDSHLRFVVNIDSTIPNELFGDETRFRQVLINILSNAVKYTDEGFVSFTVTGNFVNDDTIHLSIEIMDSGKGIKPEDIDKLFGDYVQVDAPHKKGIEGTGLGLAIARNIVRMMDGNIDVSSEYGKGSTFAITLPQKFRSRERLASVENPQNKNVIVYERRDIFATSIVRTVNNLGVNCVFVSSDAEFLEKMANETYSFVIIANALYERNISTIAEHGGSAKIILLVEFGETVQNSSLSILALPVHCISVANILNGVSDVYYYKEDDEIAMSFTAPEARVLVVDDINTNLKVAEGLLLPYGLKIDLCKNGAEAIRAVQSSRYDLVFMDHWMPEMDGIEATKHIRDLGADDPYYLQLPIIALTANAISGTQDLFLANGFNGFLAKPIDTVQLNTILDKWIAREKKGLASNVGKDTSCGEQGVPDAFNISGVDTGKGIAISAGSVERYWDTLAVFYEDGLEKIKELRSCLATGNMPLYAIHAHALKSAAANIGAVALSDAAKALEMAGKQEDLGFVEAHSPGFFADVETLLAEIHSRLVAHRGDGEASGSPLDPQSLKNRLTRLKLAIETLDAREMNDAIDYLLSQKLPDSINASIQNISRCLLTAEYDEALALTESLL